MKCGDEKITCRELTVTISYVTILNFPPSPPLPLHKQSLGSQFFKPPSTLYSVDNN